MARCEKCSNPIASKIYCSMCKGIFHASCELADPKDEKSDFKTEYLNLNAISGIKWFCNCCEVKLSEIVEHNNLNIKALSEALLLITSKYNELEKKQNMSESEVNARTPSYANVVKRAPAQIIVKPKGPESNEADRKKTRELIMSQINPDEAKVSEIANCANNGIRIATNGDSIELIESLKQSLNDEYEITEANKKRPKIKIVNFVNLKNWDTAAIEDAIKLQNEFIFKDHDLLKIVKCFEHKDNKQKLTLIAEVSVGLYHKLMKAKKVSIGWCNCFVYDAFSVTRCFKCSRFSHIEKNCKSNKESCPKCAGDHKLKDCKSNVLKCVNCVNANEQHGKNYDVNHACWSKDCVSLQSKLKFLKKGINYN